ncbi:hypothetical protein Moror_8433 [Moniliophthora roreri MCA 2997]|uniref:Uncharacterized protein n=2 Tax=Moniliophthora roreri TaxID=221103 RepID=V2W591_MONRO|nr:hypothetical protein Moror_8433 [Moniliophthora roreri MCA 2997]KAI3606391.1 hypothetical protein WG66_009616 [Moniliophthora roreri]
MDCNETESTAFGLWAAVPGVAPDRTVVVVIIFLAFYRYLRRFYPCLTLEELNRAVTKLEDTLNDAAEKGSLYGLELEHKTQARLRLKEWASEIQLRSRSSICQVYVGFHVQLVSEIIRWYNTAERLQRDVLIIVDQETQYQCNTEIRKNAATRAPPSMLPVMPTIPFSSTICHYGEAWYH